MRKILDPGFGEKYGKRTKRIVNKNGSFNVTRYGTKARLSDVFQWLITASWINFTLLIILFYICINFLFAVLYCCTGIEGLNGINTSLPYADFSNSFFFSVQTFSSLGYGIIHPSSLWTNLLVTLESLVGLASYALLTGLLYGKFSRPRARIGFSKNMVISPYKKGNSLQFRIVNERTSQLVNVTAKAIYSEVGKDFNRKYYSLNVTPETIQFFPLSWTIVHPIDEKSPFYQKEPSYFKESQGEILILIQGFDETFNQEVHTRYSYLIEEVIPDAKFKQMFDTDDQGQINLYLDQIDEIEEVKDS
ncbi:MAG: ion channel [Cyclobacteriaceae bacterium]